MMALSLRSIVGHIDLITKRRHIVDTYNKAYKELEFKGYKMSSTICGSVGEGFRLEHSDFDVRHEIEFLRVIWNLEQVFCCNIFETRILIFDYSESPPGYGRMISDLFQQELLSSTKLRYELASFLSLHEHGPCVSGSIEYMNYDRTIALISDFWPPPAADFVQRYPSSWPNAQTRNEIIKNGCYFVPIGSKLGKLNDVEWRISFADAEKKLIYSLNYCEFLLYGLLKLFLTEVINKNTKEEDKLLCSYHMKTALFWVLQQSTHRECCPENMMQYFWDCFKLILKWVYDGVCPNFFIPQDNMFLTKIYGCAQIRLFEKLHQMYENDLLKQILSLENRNTTLYFRIPKSFVCITSIYKDIEAYDLTSYLDAKNCVHRLKICKNLLKLRSSQSQRLVLQRLTVKTFNHCVFIRLSSNTKKTDKFAFRALELAEKHGCVSDLLFFAMYFYRTRRYHKALDLTDKAKCILLKPYMLFNTENMDICQEMYDENIKGKNLIDIMKNTFVSTITLYHNILYIKELEDEQKRALKARSMGLQIPPFILLLMLEFLCCRHVDEKRAENAFYFIFILTLFPGNKYVHRHYRNISRRILEICQQLSGKRKDALSLFVFPLIFSGIFKQWFKFCYKDKNSKSG